MNVVNATTVFDGHLATRAQVARLIETIGRQDFAGTVMEVIGRFLPVAHFAALLQNERSGVQVIAAASRSRANAYIAGRSSAGSAARRIASLPSPVRSRTYSGYR